MSLKPPIRCAIYTRKSTSEGLGQDFNTLDAQRESAEFTIRGMAGEGWEAIPTRYDDGGFTGANIDRPALTRLLADIEAGLVDCVVVYKVDRLSRSLVDFAKLLALFDEKGVTFVSTTQNFNTTNSMGRLTLNILLSFAQFEREMIAERTRDKMSAARRRGKWLGSAPPYGYDGDRDRMKLVANEHEAERLRMIFTLYLEHRSAPAVARELNRLGWTRKERISKVGNRRGGGAWDAKSVHRVLRDATYIGKVPFKGEVYEGEHEALIDEDTFERVQAILGSKACGRGERPARNPEYLLSGLVTCGQCGGPMTTKASKGRRGQYYRYYVCRGLKTGACAHPRLSAPVVEEVVREQLFLHCANDALHEAVVAEVEVQAAAETEALTRESERLHAELASRQAEHAELLRRVLAAAGQPGALLLDRAEAVEAAVEQIRAQLTVVATRLHAIADTREQVAETVGVMRVVDTAWGAMSAQERKDLVDLLVERVVVDEPQGRLEVAFHGLG